MYSAQCYLFETLAKCKLSLKGFHSNEYKCDSTCGYYQNPELIDPKFKGCQCSIKILDNIVNKHLESNKFGWVKYELYYFDKPAATDDASVLIRSILHMMHHSEPDVIVARIIKHNTKTESYHVRYIATQLNKSQMCANVAEMNAYIRKHFNYVGRDLTKHDFCVDHNVTNRQENEQNVIEETGTELNIQTQSE